MMATEAIKLIAGIGEPLVGTLLSYDALYMETSRFGIKRKQNCPLCGDSPSLHDAKAIAWACEVQSPELESCGFDDLEAMGQVGRDYLLLDVRNVSEVEAGSIPGHLNIPLGELGERRHELKSWENRPVVCQCQSGVRSLKAASVLLEHGFSQVSNLKGGYMGWLASQ
jgi:adenylyltransferase/sulfurtransferase